MLLAEFLIAGCAAGLIVSQTGTALYVPFWNGLSINLCPFYYIFAALVIVGAGNAVNLTYGLDGLATMPVIIASVAFMLIAYIVGRADYATYLGIPHVQGAGDLTILLGAIIGAGLAFLWFNAPPAAVFMGDTGSLARSDERRVGKEGFGTCRSRWSADHKTKKKMICKRNITK